MAGSFWNPALEEDFWSAFAPPLVTGPLVARFPWARLSPRALGEIFTLRHPHAPSAPDSWGCCPAAGDAQRTLSPCADDTSVQVSGQPLRLLLLKGKSCLWRATGDSLGAAAPRAGEESRWRGRSRGRRGGAVVATAVL